MKTMPRTNPFHYSKAKRPVGIKQSQASPMANTGQRKQVSSSGKSELSSAGVKSDSNYSKIKVRKEKCVEAPRE